MGRPGWRWPCWESHYLGGIYVFLDAQLPFLVHVFQTKPSIPCLCINGPHSFGITSTTVGTPKIVKSLLLVGLRSCSHGKITRKGPSWSPCQSQACPPQPQLMSNVRGTVSLPPPVLGWTEVQACFPMRSRQAPNCLNPSVPGSDVLGWQTCIITPGPGFDFLSLPPPSREQSGAIFPLRCLTFFLCEGWWSVLDVFSHLFPLCYFGNRVSRLSLELCRLARASGHMSSSTVLELQTCQALSST